VILVLRTRARSATAFQFELPPEIGPTSVLPAFFATDRGMRILDQKFAILDGQHIIEHPLRDAKFSERLEETRED
jgi:hypothetical protein